MNIPIEITTSHLWTILSLVVIFFVIATAVLSHHWSYYGIKGNRNIFAKSLFFIGSFFMIFFMVVLILVY